MNFLLSCQKKEKETDSETLAENANNFFLYLKDCKNSIAKQYLPNETFKLKILLLQKKKKKDMFCKYK